MSDFDLLEKRFCDVCGKLWLRHLQAEPCSHSPEDHGRAAAQLAIKEMARIRNAATNTKERDDA